MRRERDSECGRESECWRVSVGERKSEWERGKVSVEESERGRE